MVRLVVAVRVVLPVGSPGEDTDVLVADGLQPLLDTFGTLPDLRIAFSAGVPFWEQLERRHPAVASEMGALIEAGRIEPLGGPACDVVLSGVPRRDRIGQVAAQLEWSAARWGVRPRCGWVPHQVWEPTMADDLVEAGLESTILLPDPAVTTRSPHSIRSGWFQTESDGRLLGVLPADETLAGLLAGGHVDDLPGRLEASCHELGDGPVVVAVKWTGETSAGRSLVRLSKWLSAGVDWDLVTPAEALQQTRPRGRYSLPAVGKPGGSWRLERDRDPVASKLHARLLGVSCRIAEVSQGLGSKDPSVVAARWGLFRAQGAAASGEGGVPGPEILAEARRLLLEAERLADRIEDRQAGWVEVTSGDYSLDGRSEVRLQSERLTAWVDPADGRGFHELDLRDIGLSLPLLAGRSGDGTHGGPLAWLIDPETTREGYVDGSGRLFSMGPQSGQITLERSDGSAWMCWQSAAESLGPRIDWRIGMEADEGRRLLMEGRVAGLEPRAFRHLAVELPLGTGAGGDDRYLYDQRGRRWDINSTTEICVGDRVGMAEENAGVDSSIEWQPVAAAWRVRGPSIDLVIPRWEFQADENGEWSFQVQLSIDTSAAQARQLAGLAFPARRVA